MKYILFSVAVCVLFIHTARASNHSAAAQRSLSVVCIADTATINGIWFLQPVLASDTATGKTPFLNIMLAEGRFTGNTGCNNINGSFQRTDSSFTFNQHIVSTKMMCTGYDEAAFIRNLLRANHYKIEKDTLILLFDTTELSRWVRKPGNRQKINKA